MVITDDFNVFADKYHNRQHLSDDLIKMIMEINTKSIKEEKETKKKYQSVIDVINEHRLFFDEDEYFDENECILAMIEIRNVNAMDDFIDYM